MAKQPVHVPKVPSLHPVFCSVGFALRLTPTSKSHTLNPQTLTISEKKYIWNTLFMPAYSGTKKRKKGVKEEGRDREGGRRGRKEIKNSTEMNQDINF